MFIRIFFILSLFLFASDVFAQRLLIGYGIEYVDTYVRNYEGSSSFEEGPINQCEYKSKCTDGGRRQENHRPALSFELEPFYLIGNLGFQFSLDYSKEYKFRAMRFPLKNKKIDIDISIKQNRLNFGPFLIFGDKSLSRNKNSSFRIGYLFSYSQKTIDYSVVESENKYVIKENNPTGGIFINLDLSNNLSFYAYQNYERDGRGDEIKFERYTLDSESESSPKLEIREFNFIISYSIYL